MKTCLPTVQPCYQNNTVSPKSLTGGSLLYTYNIYNIIIHVSSKRIHTTYYLIVRYAWTNDGRTNTSSSTCVQPRGNSSLLHILVAACCGSWIGARYASCCRLYWLYLRERSARLTWKHIPVASLLLFLFLSLLLHEPITCADGPTSKRKLRAHHVAMFIYCKRRHGFYSNGLLTRN